MSTPVKAPRHEIHAGKVSPIVNRASSQQSREKSSKRWFTWAAVNFMVAFAFVYEWYSRQVQCWFDVDSFVVEVVVITCAVLFFLNSLIDFIRAANSFLVLNSVVLSPIQTKLMGLKKPDPSLKNSASPKLPGTSSTFSQDNFNLLNLTLSHSTPVSTFQTRRSPSVSPTSSFHTTQASPVLESFVCGESYLNKSAPFEGSGYLDSSGASPCVRLRRSPFAKSPLFPNDFMTDQKSLNNYLKSQFESSQAKMQLYGYDSSPGTNTTCWGPTSIHCNDITTADLGKNVYQLSTRSPKSPTRSKESKEAVAKIAALEYWRRARVNEDCLTEWVARLRRWISLTILRGIVKEIDLINSKLKQLGCSEVQVGDSSLHSLKQIQASKGAQIPSLSWLLPYLEVTTHQEYLVERVRELSTGYMSEFCWDKGGKMKGRREWGDDLITDCELIMHFLCVYMDLHLPPNPRYPDGRTFSAQYFVQSPDKPKPGSELVIHQTTLHPPHYQLVTKETTYDLPPGRHNMFCVILLFIHHVKSKESSMLGQVNLGLSGINILHVIEPVNNLYSDVTTPTRG